MGLKIFQLHTQCVILIYALFRATLVILLQEKRCLAYKTLIVISMIGVYPTAEIIYSTINRWKFIFQMIVSFLYMFESNLFTDSKYLGDLVEACCLDCEKSSGQTMLAKPEVLSRI